ncbi:nuclear transport factor 2 family protein [uncultured Polaribacter sp.]|uniref:nuclear transport factor 2 family protein n=1 Tax=uncultured Polaribacter sp. TaxID=174711 RepID=UPI002612F9D5|nr:nuclear transport factor 2 family protein [uncultured Polaribacter sp.]
MNSFFEPFKDSFIFKILLFIVMFFYSILIQAQVDKKTNLYKTLKSKDSIIFENAFNKCNIQKLSPMISENFEFYHDTGGIQNKKQFLETIKKNICSYPDNFTRELIEASLEVFPMKNNGNLYGAIQNGKHTFQEKQDGKLKTVGIADFTHLWILKDNQWKLKRVLSFNHKPYSE